MRKHTVFLLYVLCLGCLAVLFFSFENTHETKKEKNKCYLSFNSQNSSLSSHFFAKRQIGRRKTKNGSSKNFLKTVAVGYNSLLHSIWHCCPIITVPHMYMLRVVWILAWNEEWGVSLSECMILSFHLYNSEYMGYFPMAFPVGNRSFFPFRCYWDYTAATITTTPPSLIPTYSNLYPWVQRAVAQQFQFCN